MKQASTILVGPEPVARTPRRFGLNLEVQDHHERTNLWDWLADSGAEVAREFHPESRHWREPTVAQAWQTIHDKSAFDIWRSTVLAAPQDGIQWRLYRFDDAIPWMGVPNGFIPKVTALGIEPLYSLGYGTAFFPRPLVKDLAATGAPADDGIDWGAAASAYDFFFAVIYHCASRFGARCFTMVNEPENQWDWFHKPAEFQALTGDWWSRLSRGPDDLGLRWFHILACQYGVLARLARLALEDVRSLLKDLPSAAGFQLSGPTNVVWEPLWEQAAAHLDVCDFHHYHTEAHTYHSAYRAVALRTAGQGKKIGISEFNRLSGGIAIDRALWSHDNALDLADCLLTVLELARPDEPGCEFACFYLLNHPSTHRSYKHLLYGDTNLVDWSGRDTPLRDRGPEWYPTFAEQQVRHATPAYHVFRMLARAAAGGPRAVLGSGLTNPGSSAPHDIYERLRVQIVDHGTHLVVTLLNRSPKPAPRVTIDLGLLGRAWACAILRETSAAHDDAVIGQ